MRTLVLLLVILVSSASAQDLTRAEVAKLSPHDLSVRVLGNLGETGKAKELKFYVSPVAPTPPWLEQVEIDFPPRWLDSRELCEENGLIVDFAPRDPDARSHMLDAKYDPPTFITDVANQYRFASSTTGDCKSIPDTAYFSAIDFGQAEQAVDAFKLFLDAAANHSDKLVCVDYTTNKTCSNNSFAKLTKFSRVISVQDDVQPSGIDKREIVLELPSDGMMEQSELWLTVLFGRPGMTLERAELRNLWPPPVI
jgi:hypothetical protein